MNTKVYVYIRYVKEHIKTYGTIPVGSTIIKIAKKFKFLSDFYLYYFDFFSKKSFDFSSTIIKAPPIIKNIQLKFERFIAG